MEVACNLGDCRHTGAAQRRSLMLQDMTVTPLRLAAWEAPYVSAPDFWLNRVL